MAHFNVCGTWGTLVVDAETGVIVTNNTVTYNNITRFDLAEYAKTYGRPAAGNIDILDLGYWITDDLYIKADEYHREMTGGGWTPIISNKAARRMLQ